MTKKYLVLLLLPLVLMLGFVACEGPEGPAGLDGAPGDNGAPGDTGATGADGADGAMFCLNCHDPSVMDQKEAELAEAGHSDAYTRFNSTSCTICHSHEGFILYGDGGQEALDDAPLHGSAMSCGTCHSHSNNGDPAVFDTTDGAVPIRFTDPVVMLTGLADMDLGGNSNLCVRCHQPRRAWSEYDDETGDMVMLTSSHAGPHHGAQATALMGLNGDHRLNGLLAGMGPSPHGAAGCVSCHMNEGNHTFKPAAPACEVCHEVDANLVHGTAQADIAAKMATLAGYLTSGEGHAIERDSTDTWVVIPDSSVHGPLHLDEGEYHPVVGQYERDVYSAFWNFMTVMEDQSGGVHNPPYLEALLDASIAVFE